MLHFRRSLLTKKPHSLGEDHVIPTACDFLRPTARIFMKFDVRVLYVNLSSMREVLKIGSNGHTLNANMNLYP